MKEVAVVAFIALAVAASRLTRNAAAVSWIALAVSAVALLIAWHALRKATEGVSPQTQQVRDRVGEQLAESPDTEA